MASLDKQIQLLEEEIFRIKHWLNSKDFSPTDRIYSLAKAYRGELKKLYREFLEAQENLRIHHLSE